MFFAFFLSSILVVSTILDTVSPIPTPVDILFEDVNVNVKKDVTTADIVGVVLTNPLTNKDRMFNIKYVMAIQNSTIWSEIQNRSMTVSIGSSELFNKSPNDMTDQELSQLLRICHDGLKCVSVDKLLILKSVMVPLDSGMTLVRTAIVKITKVITEFTSEYHEDQYQYEEVKESDDLSKINETVTTIVEDNAELCRVYVDHEVEETKQENTKRKDMKQEDAKGITLVNQGVLNLGPVNININNGTVNTANIHTAASDVTVENTNDQNPSELVVYIDPKNVGYQGIVDQDNDDDHVNQNTREEQSPANASASPVSSDDNSVVQEKISIEQSTSSEKANGSIVPSVNENGNGEGGHSGYKDNSVDVNIASAGSNNKNDLRKGYVEMGNLNNGNMKSFDSNTGSKNEGVIRKTNSGNNGIINVGTINNGPTNYGVANDYNDNGNKTTINNVEVEKLAASIDKMYSSIVNGFGQI